jgi:MinD superfamily P-loop ATPase
MKTIVVVSGKGGAGKTSVAAGLLPFLPRPVLVDADVDASNLPLLVSAEKLHEEPFVGGQVAFVDADACIGCLDCVGACRFGALAAPDGHDLAPTVDSLSCEGCTACRMVCPAGAIEMRDAVSGHWFLSRTAYGPMVHARLGPAGENSGALVEKVRREAARAAAQQCRDLVLVDGPPGTGCPVISSMTGADLALVVTEPTPSGEGDLARVLALAGHFRIAAAVVIDKADLNPERADRHASWVEAAGVPVVARLPYDEAASKALCERRLLCDVSAAWRTRLSRLWLDLSALLDRPASGTQAFIRAETLQESKDTFPVQVHGGHQ